MIQRGQGAIEYLLIIGAAVIIAVIVIALMMGITSQGTSSVDATNFGDTYDEIKEDSGLFLKMNGYYIPTTKSLAKGVVALYHFDGETADEMLLDSSGNENHLKMNNGPLEVIQEGVGGSQAFRFLRSSSQTLSNDGPVSWNFTDNPTNSFSVNMWFKPEVDCAESNYGGISLSPFSRLRTALYYESGRNYYYHQIWASTPVSMGDSCVVGEWDHLVGTYDSPTDMLTLYVNGVPMASVKSNDIDTSGRTDGINIGHAQNYFNGVIDEVIVWNRTLNTAEVQTLFEGY